MSELLNLDISVKYLNEEVFVTFLIVKIFEGFNFKCSGICEFSICRLILICEGLNLGKFVRF